MHSRPHAAISDPDDGGAAGDGAFKLPDEVQARLEHKLALADRDLARVLADFWSPIEQDLAYLSRLRHRELIQHFEALATHIVHAKADALIALGNDVPNTTRCIEKTLIPHAVDLIVPVYVIPEDLWHGRDLRDVIVDFTPHGFWEERLCSSWQLFRTKVDVDSNSDVAWRFWFQLALRFPENRSPFMERLTTHLKGSIVDWKARAWHEVVIQLSQQRTARQAVPAVLAVAAPHRSATVDDGNHQDGPDLTRCIAERAARRQAVVMPILKKKRWKAGRLAVLAGVGKNSVYEYLDGTRVRITNDNRVAIAQALDLKPEQLPD